MKYLVVCGALCKGVQGSFVVSLLCLGCVVDEQGH